MRYPLQINRQVVTYYKSFKKSKRMCDTIKNAGTNKCCDNLS